MTLVRADPDTRERGLVSRDVASRRGAGRDPGSRLDPRLATGVVAAAAVVLALDLYLPLGVAGGVPYVAVVLAGWWSHRLWVIFLLALLSTFLTLVGYAFSPSGGIPWVVLANRALAIFAIWITAVLLAWAKSAERKLRAARDDLDCKVMERTRALTRSNLRLRAACDDARIANQAKTQFLAIMSHELRTPLNAVIGFSDILAAAPAGSSGDARYRAYAEDIGAAGQRLLRLVNDILCFSEAGRGVGALEEAVMDIDGLTAVVAARTRESADARAIALTWEVAGGLPQLHADRGKMEQVLLELVANAIKFTEPGGSVAIRVWHRSDSGMVMQVKDTGPGIPLREIPSVLSPFYQVDGGLNRRHGGIGLGLSLAKSFVELHGGSLDLQSEVGAGTTVTVRLPPDRLVLRCDAYSMSSASGSFARVAGNDPD